MAAQTKPNILFIMTDDIGWFNASCYNHDIMGYQTPNIDRIAKEGAMFTAARFTIDQVVGKLMPKD